mgnify:FL=1|tara:strand:+ start:3948 stop:4406 length:459 start_codon:yes stop_codon:yes gene_type:complete
MKFLREILWLLVAFILVFLIQYPILKTINYKYLYLNSLVILLAIYYVRFVLDFHHLLQNINKWIRFILFSINFFVFIAIIYKIQHHLVLFDNFTISSYTDIYVLLTPKKESSIIHYVNKEFLFTGVVLLVSIGLLNIKLLKSFWTKKAISEY